MNKFILITGASSGIGRSLALECAARGHSLLLLGRDVAALTALSEQLSDTPVDVHVFPGDLLDMSYREELYRWLANNNFAINGLINNAGFGLVGPFDQLPLQQQLDMVQLNVSVLIELTHKLLPLLKKNNSARILQVSSLGAFLSGPYITVYYATKAFVHSFCSGLRKELQSTSVTLTELCPGPVPTKFGERAGFKLSKGFNFLAVESHVVANTAYIDLFKGKALSIPGKLMKCLFLINKITPNWLSEWLMLKMMTKRTGKKS